MEIVNSGDNTNGVFLDPAINRGLGVNDAKYNADGALVTKKTYEERLNVQEGIVFEKYKVDGSVDKKIFEVTPQGEGYLNGTLRVKQMFIRDNDVEALISEKGETKIKGAVINPKGITVSDGAHSFDVDQSAQVSIQNGNIRMENGTNTLSLMESSPITVYNKKSRKNVMQLDADGNLQLNDIVASGTITGGKIISDTEINVTTDAEIGRSVVLKDGSLPGGKITIWDAGYPIFSITPLGGRDFLISKDGGKQFEINGNTTYIRGVNELRLGSGNGGVFINGQKPVTEGELDDLSRRFASLEGRVSALEHK